MIVYIAYFFFIIVLAVFTQNARNGKNTFLFWSILVMWLMIGFRSIAIGSDTADYAQQFIRTEHLNLQYVKEPLFAIATYAIRQLTDNFNIYFLIIESVYCLSLYLLLKKFLNNSIEALIAISLLFLLGIYAFSVAGLRQTIAIGFVILALLATVKKKWWLYAICIALATGFHNSALMMIPMFLFPKIGLKRFAVPLVVGMVLLGLFAPQEIISFLSAEDSMVGDRYGTYGTVYESHQNFTGFFLQLILVSLAHYRRDKIVMTEELKNLFFNMAYLGLGFQSMTIVVAEFFRVSFYFCIFDIVLAPLALSTYGKNRNFIYLAFMIGCLFYIFVLAQESVIPMVRQ